MLCAKAIALIEFVNLALRVGREGTVWRVTGPQLYLFKTILKLFDVRSAPEQHQTRLLSVYASVFFLALHIVLLSERHALPKQTAKQLVSLPLTPFSSLLWRHEVL